MIELMETGWPARLEKIDFAFQPIVNIYTGNTFGFEALLRCHRQAGFTSIDGLFDQAYREGLLHHVDLFLRHTDPKKRLVVSTIVNFANFMGSLVLAEGVETLDEYLLCKEIGCDMIQGYFVQRPSRDLGDLRLRYEEIKNISQNERRNKTSRDQSLISGEIEFVPPVYSDCDMVTIIEKFRKDDQTSFFPVINRHDEPIGVIRDTKRRPAYGCPVGNGRTGPAIQE